MCALSVQLAVDASERTRLPKLARKRLERFATLFPKALINDAPETIHDLRVASRRLQQVLRILLPSADSSANRKLSRVLRKTRRALGACRNFDVSLGLIEKQREGASSASIRQAWETVKIWVEEKRVTGLKLAREQLKRCDVIDFIIRVQTRLDNAHQEPISNGDLAERLQRAVTAWEDALACARADPQVKTLHALRIAGKRLRYRAESLATSGDGSVKRLVRDLRGLQDNLGDWHDRAVLRQHVAEFIERPGFLAEEPGMCRSLLLEMERGKQHNQTAISDLIAQAELVAHRHWEHKSIEQPGDKVINEDQ